MNIGIACCEDCDTINEGSHMNFSGSKRNLSTQIGAWSTAVWAQKVLARPHKPTPVGKILAASAAALHEEMGLKTNVCDDLLSRLANEDAAVIRLAHQPNLFPYEQLVAQSVYLSDAGEMLSANGRSVVPIVFVVDYDESYDDRVRIARALDPTSSEQIRRFRVKGRKSVPTFLAEPPDNESQIALTNQLAAFAKSNGCNPDYIIEHSGIQRSTRSLADHNVFSWMNLTVGIWKLPLLFLRLSDIAPHFEEQRLYLANQMASLSSEDRARYLWRVCRRCQCRSANGSGCCEAADYLDWSLPRVAVDDLSDYQLYGVSGGTAYYKAVDHLGPAHAIGRSLGLDIPPEACWRLGDLAFTTRANFAKAQHSNAQIMLRKGHNSLLEHILDADRAGAFLKALRIGIIQHLV